MCVVLVNAAHTPGRYLREGWRVSNPQRDEVALHPVGPGGGSHIWGQARGAGAQLPSLRGQPARGWCCFPVSCFLHLGSRNEL